MITVIERTDPRLGRNVNHDNRSRLYPFRAPHATDDWVSVRHERHVPVWDQGQIGSCTGNAGLGCVATGKFWDADHESPSGWTEREAVSIYERATLIDPYEGSYPPDDTGSDGLSVAKVLTNLGFISGYTHAFSLEDALSALQTVPLIVGTRWYSSMFDPDPVTAEVSVTAGASVAGGHEYILDEYRADDGMIGCQNSWGLSWGRGGRFYLHMATLRRLLGEDGDATVFTPNTAPAPEPIGNVDLAAFASKINRWRRSHHPVYGAHTAQRAVDAYLSSQGL